MGIFRELVVYPRLLSRMLPLVERELAGWRAAAGAIPDADLRAQALSSLQRKKFHCVGGAVLALLAPVPAEMQMLVRAIVAIQTISDYLDNLCDRSLVAEQVAGQAAGQAAGQIAGQVAGQVAGQLNKVLPWRGVSLRGTADDTTVTETPSEGTHTSGSYGFLAGENPRDVEVYLAYLRLHEAMLCAVDTDRPTVDYYDAYLRFLRGGEAGPDETSADGGYLARLVEASRRTLRELPAYAAAKPLVTTLVTLYSELQAGKHLAADIRDGVMEMWHAERNSAVAQPTWLSQPPAKWLGHDLRWWEFGAATGSTLAMFALICASSDPTFTTAIAEALARAYFPSICGLHILLDYYIDQTEDIRGGDLNFVAHYPSQGKAVEALEGFTRWALHEASSCTPNRDLHRAVVRGLLAMYLSDPKIAAQGLDRQASRIARAAGGLALPLKSACSISRRLTGF